MSALSLSYELFLRNDEYYLPAMLCGSALSLIDLAHEGFAEFLMSLMFVFHFAGLEKMLSCLNGSSSGQNQILVACYFLGLAQPPLHILCPLNADYYL